MNQDAFERRRYTRSPCEVDVRCDVGGHYRHARMVNISQGGCYIEAVLPGDIEGKPVVVLAEGAPLRGYVAHVEPQQGFGVQFSFDPAEQHALRAAVQKFLHRVE
ncbi:MAG TPA: PilZ domain-containing protein [Vicinamibacterales bacterium]|nr:PilZ domain-containing protein [Vicinamibacterales bacterium]